MEIIYVLSFWKQNLFLKKFCWFSFQIDGGPFPHAQKAKKYDLENL